MLDEKGRHTWHYLEEDEAVQKWPQSIADKYYLGLDTVCYIVPPFHIAVARTTTQQETPC